MPRRIAALSIALVLVAYGVWRWADARDRPVRDLSAERRVFATNDPLERACDLTARAVARIWRGHDPERSEDITTVPLFPNYSGSFGVTSHSGPWDYLQTIPLVLYGPRHIRPRGSVEGSRSITDVYPTVAALTGTELPSRDGRVLAEALESIKERPRLIVVVVWDGVGRNTLERHPDAWPTLKMMEEEGTSYVNAVVGSSPSITPATHSSLGTGAYPRRHRVTAIEMRADARSVVSAFGGKDPSDLELTTFADQIDIALGNEPRVGMLAWKSWHMGMLGHGAALEGGDGDELAIIGTHGDVTGNEDLYTTPPGLIGRKELLEEQARLLDAEDGERDGEWRGRDPLEMHDNPAWVYYQSHLLLDMLEQGGYGRDEVPDLFFTNFKVTDIVSHQYSMDSVDETEALRAQDGALHDLLDFLNVNAGGNYVVIVTSDHGNTPSPERSGAWPVQQGQLQEDVDAHFRVPDGRSLIQQTTAVGPFLDRRVMRETGVTEDDVARFLNGYTVAENWGEPDLPEGYEERGEENVFAAAFPSDAIDEVTDCVFGGRPPKDLQA